MSQIGMEVPRNLDDIPGHTRWEEVEDSEDGQDVNRDDESEEDPAYADESVVSSLFGSDDEGSDFPVGKMAPGSKKRPEAAERLIKNEVIDQIWKKGRLRRESWKVIDRTDRTLYHDIEQKLGDIAGQKWSGDLCINDLSLPAKWLRKIDWGFHCNQCKAWWLGEIKIDLETRQQYPNLGMRCWLCQRYAQDVREVVNPNDAEEIAWAKRAAEMGPPPPNYWAALVQANNVHESDFRRIAARLADRMPVEGYPWDAIEKLSPYEMLITLGMSSVGRLESKLDLAHMLTVISHEVANIEKTHTRGRHIGDGRGTPEGSAVRESDPDGMEVESVRPPEEKTRVCGERRPTLSQPSHSTRFAIREDGIGP